MIGYTILFLSLVLNDDWKESYNELNDDWKAKYNTAAENYERQIETLTKKLNERGKE